MEDAGILTIKEVAEYLRVSERTVSSWAQKDEIPCGKFGSSWRFRRADIRLFLDASDHFGPPLQLNTNFRSVAPINN